MEIQKTTLNGQAAVEMRTPEKPKRASKDRPISMPPNFLDKNFLEGSDGETSADNAQKRDVAAKPKKRQAPLPPTATQAPPILEESSTLSKDTTLASTNVGRSHHTRRGSDSSSGYHGSSQPSPNPPAIGDASGAAVSSLRNASGSEKSTFSYKSRASGDGPLPQTATEPKDDTLDVTGQKKKPKAPLPPATSAGPDVTGKLNFIVFC